MLVEDSTRRVGYKYTCRLNAKEFKCKHSLGVAILRGMLVPSPEAKCQQLARLRRKGRKAAAPPALVYPHSWGSSHLFFMWFYHLQLSNADDIANEHRHFLECCHFYFILKYCTTICFEVTFFDHEYMIRDIVSVLSILIKIHRFWFQFTVFDFLFQILIFGHFGPHHELSPPKGIIRLPDSFRRSHHLAFGRHIHHKRFSVFFLNLWRKCS